jgi:putative transposase
VVDTLGHLWRQAVHSAGESDRAGAKRVLATLPASVRRLWADQNYSGPDLGDWVTAQTNATLEVVSRRPGSTTFEVLPQRWKVERTFAWLGRHRRLSKDYEHHTKNSESVVWLASISRTLRLVAQNS